MSFQLTAEEVQARDRLRFEIGTSSKILDAEDERTVKGMLFEERRYLSSLDQEIHRLESILTGLYKTREPYIARIDKCAVALSPQKCIPPEILTEIFAHSLCDQPPALPPSAKKTPWVLLWICSRWRQVALAEPRLWSNLDINYSQLDTTESLVTTWIPYLWGKTQNFPVTLTLTSFEDRFRLRDVLLPYFQRLRSLSLAIPRIPLSVFLRASPISFDLLDSLALDLTQNALFERTHLQLECPPSAVFTLSPSLRNVTLHSRSMVSINTSGLSQLPWSQMTHITFLMVQISLTELRHILMQSINLVSLTFTPLSTTPVTMSAALTITLLELRSLTWITGDISSASGNFTLLSVPSMVEFTMKGTNTLRRHTQPIRWSQSLFINMLNRSGCTAFVEPIKPIRGHST